MPDFWRQLFDPNVFMPHVHCYLWNAGLIRLHVFTDLAIGFSYVAISVALGSLIWRARKDVPFTWMFVAFGAFTLACGATHFMEVWTLWTPLYWVSGMVKLVTASASVITALMLPPLIPKALALIQSAKVSARRKADLEATIQQLVREIAEGKRRDLEIRELNADMQRLVVHRSIELETANQGLCHVTAILDNSIEAIISLDLDFVITGWNLAAERMFGYEAAEALGCAISILSPPELYGETPKAIQRYMTGVGASSFETVRVRKNGSKIDVYVMLSLITDGMGIIRGTSLVKRDITERKLAQEILRVAVEAAPSAMVMADETGKIVLINSQTESLFGYTRLELLGQMVDVLVPGRHHHEHRGVRAEFMAQPRARAMGEGRDPHGLRKDGVEFPVEIGLNPIRMSGSTWVLSSILDITERKRAQHEIIQLNQDLERRVGERTQEVSATNLELVREISERKLREAEIRDLNAEMGKLVARRTAQLESAHQALLQMGAILENSLEPIVCLDLKHMISSWNGAAERMFGYQAAEVLGRSVSLLSPADRPNEMRDAIQRYANGTGPSSIETTHLRKNGELVDVDVMLSLIRNEAGVIQGTLKIYRDITQRNLAHEMLRMAVDAAPSGMVMTDRSGKIVLVNSQTEAMFGYTRAELLGHGVDVLVPARDRQGHSGSRSEFMAHPAARPASARGRDLYGLRKDGTEFPVEIGLNPIQISGETWVLSAVVDITERKRAQREILQLNQDLERRVAERTEELSAANADLETFSYTVAHDLRAPLRHIAGFANILAEEHGSGMNAEARGLLKTVQNAAQQMGNLIDHLLNLATLGRQPVSRRVTNLNALVATARASLAQEGLARQIEWNVGELGSFECDAGLMQQVFVNLLSNAIKYTRFRETARIEVARTMIDGEGVISVRDNGAGFEMKYAGKLFGVFQRLHKARDFEGTGVGLATVQRIITKHGGRIWADAHLDQGATFSFTIPRGFTRKSGEV